MSIEIANESGVGVDTDATLDTGAAGPPATAEPLVLVLSREVPDQVLLRTEPVEVVRVHIDRSTTERQVSATVSREQAEVRETPSR